MAQGKGIGAMRNRHVERHSAGACDAHEGTAARILARTAQSWEVK